MDASQEAARLADELLYDDFYNRPNFNLEEFLSELDRNGEHLKSQLGSTALALIGRRVDRKSRRGGSFKGQPCFPGWNVDGIVLALRGGDRVPKRFATIEQIEIAIDIKRDNVAAVTQRLQEDIDEVEKLRPYWTGRGTPMQDAIAAYEADRLAPTS
jgi:hypothetical protein